MKLTEADLSELTQTEVIIAAKGPEHWEFSASAVSSFFTYAVGENWSNVVYAPYYRDFWSQVLGELTRAQGVVEIRMECQYSYGSADDESLHAMMQTWASRRHTNTKPNMLSVAEMDTDGLMTIVHLVILDFTIKALSDA